MIIALIITAYLVVALLASRPVYGHLRARSIDGCARRWKSLYHTNEQFDMGRWNSLDRTGVLASATALSLLWPYLVIAAGAGRWMTGTKIRSGVEIEVERKALGARIASLEQELGIK